MRAKAALSVGQAVYWKRSRVGSLSIRRIPAKVLKIAGQRIQILLGEPVSDQPSNPWVSRGSLQRLADRSYTTCLHGNIDTECELCRRLKSGPTSSVSSQEKI